MSVQRFKAFLFFAELALVLSMPALAYASPTGAGPGLMWEGSFKTILTSVQVACATLLVICVIVAGLKISKGEGGGAGGTLVNLIIGGGLVLGATTFIDVVFAGASGLPL